MNRGNNTWQGRPVGQRGFVRPSVGQIPQFAGGPRPAFPQAQGQFANTAWTQQHFLPNFAPQAMGRLPFQQNLNPGLLPTPAMFNQNALINQGALARMPVPIHGALGPFGNNPIVSHTNNQMVVHGNTPIMPAIPIQPGGSHNFQNIRQSTGSNHQNIPSHNKPDHHSHRDRSASDSHRQRKGRSPVSHSDGHRDHHRHRHSSPRSSDSRDEHRHRSAGHDRHRRDKVSHHEHRSHTDRARRTDGKHAHREDDRKPHRSHDADGHRKRHAHSSTERSSLDRSRDSRDRESRYKEHRGESHEERKRKRGHDYDHRRSEVSPKRARSHIDRDPKPKPKIKPMKSPSSAASSFTVAKETTEDEDEKKPHWIRCTPTDQYYSKDPMDQKHDSTVAGTSKLRDLYDRVRRNLVERGKRCREDLLTKIPDYKEEKCVHRVEVHISDSESSSSDSDNDSESDTENFEQMNEMRRKKKHPLRLHEELWFNDPGEMNDGPLCKCSYRARQTGIRHNIYPGEGSIPACDPLTNNAGRLHHYRVTVSPGTNFLSDRPTVIEYDDHEYIFEGFSMFSHYPLDTFPQCNVIRFNIEYTIYFLKEPMPEHFCIEGLNLFDDFLFEEILELHDFDLKDANGRRPFYFMPRFVRSLPDNGKEVLSMHQVLLYLLKNNRPLVEDSELAAMLQMDELEWEKVAEETKNMIVSYPGKKPSSVRIDQLDREQSRNDVINYPVIVHFGTRPAQLSYAGDPGYQKLFKAYLKMRHLMANRPKVTYEDRQKLMEKEEQLQKLRSRGCMKREVTVELSSQGMIRTGIRSDVCQHAMMLPVLVHHLRYFACLHTLDKKLGYTFKDRALFKLAMTHPSHHLNFGMNPDHVRNSLSNCGVRQPEYGDRRIHHEHTRKKGINTLINIMSRMASEDEIKSRIQHNERLEFLGDAVLEFIISCHLYYLFPHLEEGGLATYRMALVQNQHLAVLAKKLDLDHYMLYAHGPDLCHSADLKHAMANCFEALMGALYMEAGQEKVKEIFCKLLFCEDDLQGIWMNHPAHPLQHQEPGGDRHLIDSSPVLQKLTDFENSTGIEFNHIRLLARSFTQRTVGYTNLTLGHNQRLEFLGDSAMQLVASEYLFKHFPDHHEGHLSLLRSSLVNNRTQATVAGDLGMEEYIINFNRNREKEKPALRVKVLADLLEAFLGALYVDKSIEWVRVFCEVCFFPRLRDFIVNQDWNDPKSQLQQCCLTLRTEGKEPDIPVYKIVNQVGPSHSRKYTVAVYFKGDRLASGSWSSVQQAEMMAAKNALESYKFPQLKHQKKFIELKYKKPGKQKADKEKEKEQ
ncbi:ribonuclease 3-like [Ptychodera flava]|uniref:ribonuclease 3-like n=1 Tax=Ptychodera flava TaxID=63121 RepID=UPI003969E7DE